jgi:regulator of RNase E activity RraA
MFELTDDLIAQLKALDTPTVCNALEIVAPGRRGSGFTTKPLVCARPALEPVIGFARTATLRAAHPTQMTGDPDYARDSYFEYIDAGPKPSIVVIQDLDPEPGYGSFWGEVNSNIHKGLGCEAVITNGSVRDLPDLADGFQVLADRVGPSHAYVHIVDFSRPVTVAGMAVGNGELIHADQHGAVIIPTEVAADIPAAAALIARQERVLIDAAQRPGFDMAALSAARTEAAKIT